MRTYINRMLLCLVMFIGIGTAEAAADNLFVITDGNGNYLANSGGTVSNATSFDAATCVWTGETATGGTLKNNGYYLVFSSSSSGNTVSLSQSASAASSWTVVDNKVYATGQYSTSYYILYKDGTWKVFSNNASVAYCYATTLTQTEEAKSMEVKYNTGRKAGGEGTFEREGDTRNYYVDLSYTPAYNTYSWTTTGSETATYYASSDNSYTSATAPEAITTATSYKWTTDYPDNVTFDDDESDEVEAVYETKFDTDTEVTITATATIKQSASGFMTADVALTAADKVTLKSRWLTQLQISVKDDDDKTVSSLFVGETAKVNYSGWYDEGNVTVTFSSSNPSIATVSSDGVITAMGTGSGGGDEAEVAITVSTAETTDYEAGSATIRLTVKKHTTSLDFAYDKTSLTYGEAAPTITSLVLKDVCEETTVESPTYIFSSNDNCIGVDATTGALTINYAGTATITAAYQGDDIHAKTRATAVVTVSKAATTLTFEQDSYIAQLTHLDEFTSPTATLSPEGIGGSVTYGYTSETANLISIDEQTGKITFNGLTGTATVTASFAGNNRYEASSAEYVLTVSSKEMPGLSITIDPSELYVDQTRTVTISTPSANGYTVASSDESVFSISGGTNDMYTLTAVGEGSAVLYVTSAEDDTYMEVTASMPIVVKRWPTTMTLTYPQDHYYTDHESGIVPTVTVKATGTWEMPTLNGRLSYSTAENSVLTVDASTGRITMLGSAGSAEITATYAGDNKFAPSSATTVITIKLAITPGTFVRLKDASGNYLSCSEADGSVGATTNTADASNIIWYGTDRSLLFYGCGLYMKDATPQIGSAVDVGTGGTRFSFSHTGDNYRISDGTNTLTSDGDENWTMEVVDCLPLTFNSAGYGYATLYSPVDLSCPAGVVAYYPTARAASESGASGDNVITLKSVTGGYIPHGTPVVLYTSFPDVTYDFYIINGSVDAPSDLWTGIAGSVATVNTASAYSGTQWPYALQPLKSKQSVGFYPWKSDSHATIPGFRCYIPGSEASNAKGFRFAFDDSTNAIGNINADSSAPAGSSVPAAVYNLQGIRVADNINSLRKGVYVSGGKKVVKSEE